MTKKLQVKCKTCGKWFMSGIQMDEESFKTTKLDNNSMQYPDGHMNSYNKSDMEFR